VPHSTFGSRDVIGHVIIFDSPCHFLWSFGTESLNPAVFEILRSKSIVVTSLTFQGHVTSSVTWPLIAHMSFPIGGPSEPSLYL